MILTHIASFLGDKIMNKETQELLSKIMALAYEVNEETSNDVFIRFSGHVKSIDVSWYPNGWTRHDDSAVVDGCDINGTIYLEDTETLQLAVESLENLLK